MKTWLSLLFMAALGVSAQAQTPAASSESKPASTATPAPVAKTPAGTDTPKPADAHSNKPVPIRYIAPKNAVPRKRVDAVRGGSIAEPSLYVLAPNHTGLTSRAQPSLFFYQSGSSHSRLELTITDPKQDEPVLQVGIDKADKPGIHRILLGRYNVSLKPGVTYDWNVAWIPEPGSPSKNIIARGSIQRTEGDAQLNTALASAEGANKAAVYASKGYWYDALEAVNDAINAAPKDPNLVAQQGELLKQGGLGAVASAKRQ